MESSELEQLDLGKFQFLNNCLEHHQVVGSLLFTGAKLSVLDEFSLYLACASFCTNLNCDHQPCLHCASCQRVLTHQHQQVLIVETSSSTIKVDQIRSMQASLGFTGMESSQKVVIIREAEKMNQISQNSLLKLIEEPADNLQLILITTNPDKLLPTILSRVQVVRFDQRDLTSELIATGIEPRVAKILNQLNFSVEEAKLIWADPQFLKLVTNLDHWLNLLVDHNWNAFIEVSSVIIVDLKEKQRQNLALDLFTGLIEARLKDAVKSQQPSLIDFLAKLLARNFLAQQKWQSNVSLQNVWEQLSLELLNSLEQ